MWNLLDRGKSMEKIFKNKLTLILNIFILLHPIIDLITGMCLHLWNINLTLGNVIRILFLAFIMFISVFIYKNKKSFLYYFIVGIYSILYIGTIVIFKDNVGLFGEIQGLIRTFYFPIILLSLYNIKDEIKINKPVLFFTLLTYLLCIFIPIMFGIGFDSYQVTKSGTLGFYNSANEISGIISILTPIMFIMFKKIKNVIFTLGVLVVYFIVILTVGTKTPLLSFLITLGMLFVWIISKCIKSKKYNIIVSLSLVTIIGISSLILIFPKTNFYKNIKVHLDFLKVDNIVDVLKDEELIDHFIFSQRLTFWENRENDFKDVSVYEKLIGVGYSKNGKTIKQVEMDYVDVYYNHGIIGFILFFSAYIFVIVTAFKQKQKLTFERYMTLTSFILILFLSLFTGHIIVAPAVSLIAIAVILNLFSSKKELFFAINTLEMGGIEKSIINLLNNINYDKYNVTLAMEEKKGIFLAKLNKNVKVMEVKVSSNKNVIIRKFINLYRKFIFFLLNYHAYDFSCCYATYSLSANVLSRIASSNNALYVHSNYTHIYDYNNFRKFFDSRSIDKFKNIIFVSNEAKEDFCQIYTQYHNKSLVFNNFINYEEIKKLSSSKIKENKNKDKKLFVFIGRLDDSSKKVGRAINLVKEIDEINLWIVGDGPDREMYESIVEKNKLNEKIKFLGSKENPYPYIKCADYIILTSDYEGFPVVYLESLILEKPIITTILVSDDEINIKDIANIVSKQENEMVKEVKNILKKNQIKNKIDFEKIQIRRMKKLEKIFDNID